MIQENDTITLTDLPRIGGLQDIFYDQTEVKRYSALNGEQRKLDFGWLTYDPRMPKITRIESAGSIMSGNFSGCWMMRYTQGARTYVCHIGTVNGKAGANTANTNTAVKNEWNTFMGKNLCSRLYSQTRPLYKRLCCCTDVREEPKNPVTDVRGFNPYHTYRSEAPGWDKKVWGLITPGSFMYALKVMTDTNTKIAKVLSIKPVSSASLNTLIHLS